MKDFYDIFYLAQTYNFDGPELCKALKETLQNRKTEYDKDSFNRVLQLADNNDIQVRWRYFQKTINKVDLSLPDVMGLIDKFLHSVFNSLISGEIYSKKWDARTRKWM
jgi:hypothetical protein